MGCAFAPPSSAAACANEDIRKAQTSEALPNGSTYLPHCMALEMVSPPIKRLQDAFGPSFSSNGERVLYRARAALGETPGLMSAPGDSYVASRGASGWSTAATSPPTSAEIFNGFNFGGPYGFSADFSHWVLFGGTSSQVAVGVGQLFSGSLDGSLDPLSPLLVPNDQSSGDRLNYDTRESLSSASSADLSTTVLRPKLASTSYLPGDPSASTENDEPGGDLQTYVAFRNASGEPQLQLLARDKEGNVYGGRCGSHVGGPAGTTGSINQGAISPTGSRIYFSTRPNQAFDEELGQGPPCSTSNPLRILVRTQNATETEPQISELIPGEPAAPGDDLYQGASLDGMKVYLTTTRKLSPDDEDSGSSCSSAIGASTGCDLYLYDFAKPEAERITDVSAGGAGDPEPGTGADVLSSITAVSTDGSHVYFAAQGVLTTVPNPAGDTATAGKPNLYLYDAESGETSFVGTLAAADKGSLWGTEESYAAEASAVPLLGQNGGDGHVLIFASKAALTKDDTDGGFRDVFRYDAESDTLERISKAGPEGAEVPAANVTVNPNGGAPNTDGTEIGRWVSEDGNSVAFATAEPLMSGEDDGETHPYLWTEGKVFRLPGDNPTPPSLSSDGSEVGFTSTKTLVPQDGDTALDVYVARADGGFPNPPAPNPCDPLSEGSCQQSSSQRSVGGAPATAAFTGPGNPISSQARCKKGRARRHGRCIKPRQTHHKKQAGRGRGGTR